MLIKDIYKEVENEKKNKPKSKVVTMEIEEFCKEHKNLIKILRTGSREELLAEADKQEEELEEYEDNEEEED